MLFLSGEDIIRIARRVIGPDVVIRDPGLIEAASARPQATVGGHYAYADVSSMAAALTHSLVTNHALVDGNKRLGLACLIVFLRINGVRLSLSNDDAYDLIYGIASGDIRDVDDIARTIEAAGA